MVAGPSPPSWCLWWRVTHILGQVLLHLVSGGHLLLHQLLGVPQVAAELVEGGKVLPHLLRQFLSQNRSSCGWKNVIVV